MYVYIEVPQEGLFIKHLMTGEDMQCSLFSFIRTRSGIIEYQKDFWQIPRQITII